MSAISKRERAVLHDAVTLGLEVIVNGRGVAHWDGDTTMPFKAFKSLDKLIDKGLMVRNSSWGRSEWYRASAKTEAYRCRAGCQRGRLYDEDTDIGKCQSCDGTGISLSPHRPEDPTNEQ